jgi:hypothetical protein
MKVYDGSLWVAAYASLSGAMFGANNLSDVADAAGSRANLGLVIGTNVQAFSAILQNTTASYTTAEETKLAGIEAGATGDQSASEIRSLVEAATDSNVFTDADHTKLNAIEANAKDDQTITAGSGLTGGGTGNVTLNHADTSTVSNANNSGNTFIQDINFDGFGHVTSVGTGTVSVGDGTLTVQGTGALGGSGTFTANQSGNATISISHDDTSSQGSVNNSGATVVQDVTLDGYGHVTGLGSHTLTLANLGYTGATNANYITNNNQLSNGAGYTTNVGDITNVTAGTNLTGGGSSGSVTVNLTASPNITSLNVGGSEVISNSRALKNIASVDATTVAAFGAAGVGGTTYVPLSGTSQTLDLSAGDFFYSTHTADTTLSFSNIPAGAYQWSYAFTPYVAASSDFSAFNIPSVNTFDITTLSSSVSSGDIDVIHISSDGTKVLTGGFAGKVHYFTLLVRDDITTATYVSTWNHSVVFGGVQGIWMNDAGTRLFLCGSSNGDARQFNLSTGWDFTTISYSGLSKSGSSNQDFTMSADGTKSLHTIWDPSGELITRDHTTAYEINTGGNATSQDLTDVSRIRSAKYSPDGTSVIAFDTNQNIRRYPLTTAYNLNTRANASGQNVRSVATQGQNLTFSDTMQRIFWAASGTVYWADNASYSSVILPSSTGGQTILNASSAQRRIDFFTTDGGTTVNYTITA